MDTKFKNKDILIQVLDRCMQYRYYGSFMLQIRDIVINKDMTFERAFWICIPSYLQDRVYRKISQMYHMDIRILNVNKFYKKQKGIDNNG